jgi:FtsP/CotA-like multicopper oxidase with cupredoxin domain
MGRFGNVMLINGETSPQLSANQGEVVRLYLVNTANVRVFNVRLLGARMKLVGGDNGRVEREEFVEEVLLSPSERVIVDVFFEHAGQFSLEHHTPDRTYPLATVIVQAQPSERGSSSTYARVPNWRRCASRLLPMLTAHLTRRLLSWPRCRGWSTTEVDITLKRLSGKTLWRR